MAPTGERRAAELPTTRRSTQCSRPLVTETRSRPADRPVRDPPSRAPARDSGVGAPQATTSGPTLTGLPSAPGGPASGRPGGAAGHSMAVGWTLDDR